MLKRATLTLFLLHLCIGKSEELKCPPKCRCYEERQIVFCNNKQLIHVPLGIPRNTRILHLQGNNIISSSTLEVVLSNLKRLEKLDLTHNNLTSLPRGLPPTLNQLILTSNNIKYIGKDALQGLSSLSEIRLDNNSITNEGMSRTALSGAKNLTRLTLTNNKLTGIPTGLPSSLKLLYLNQNKIGQLRVVRLMGLNKLIRLDLSKNTICDEGIQENAFKMLTSLNYLDLNDNCLRDIPHSIPNTLQYLLLANNKIRYIYTNQPDMLKHKKVGTFRELTELVELDLSNNLLRSIEENSFDSLQKLLLIRFNNNPWKCDCHLKYFLKFVSKLIKNDIRQHIICSTPLSLKGVALNNLDPGALICKRNAINFTTTIDLIRPHLIKFNWTKTSLEAIPPFVRNFVLYGTLKCNEDSEFYNCNEQLKKTKYIKDLIRADGYKELKAAYGTGKPNQAVLDNLISNKKYIICLYDSSNPTAFTQNQCVKFQTPSETSASLNSDIMPVWIIIVCTASLFVVAMSGFGLLLCRQRKSGKFQSSNSAPERNSNAVETFQRQYVGQLLRKEGMLTENEVIMRNHSDRRDSDECRKSTTLDAGKEFNVTLVNHKNGVRLSTISTTILRHDTILKNPANKSDESFSSCKTTTSTIGSCAHDRPYFAFKTEPRHHECRSISIDAYSVNQYKNKFNGLSQTIYSTRCCDQYPRSTTGYYV